MGAVTNQTMYAGAVALTQRPSLSTELADEDLPLRGEAEAQIAEVLGPLRVCRCHKGVWQEAKAKGHTKPN